MNNNPLNQVKPEEESAKGLNEILRFFVRNGVLFHQKEIQDTLFGMIEHPLLKAWLHKVLDIALLLKKAIDEDDAEQATIMTKNLKELFDECLDDEYVSIPLFALYNDEETQRWFYDIEEARLASEKALEEIQEAEEASSDAGESSDEEENKEARDQSVEDSFDVDAQIALEEARRGMKFSAIKRLELRNKLIKEEQDRIHREEARRQMAASGEPVFHIMSPEEAKRRYERLERADALEEQEREIRTLRRHFDHELKRMQAIEKVNKERIQALHNEILVLQARPFRDQAPPATSGIDPELKRQLIAQHQEQLARVAAEYAAELKAQQEILAQGKGMERLNEENRELRQDNVQLRQQVSTLEVRLASADRRILELESTLKKMQDDAEIKVNEALDQQTAVLKMRDKWLGLYRFFPPFHSTVRRAETHVQTIIESVTSNMTEIETQLLQAKKEKEDTQRQLTEEQQNNRELSNALSQVRNEAAQVAFAQQQALAAQAERHAQALIEVQRDIEARERALIERNRQELEGLRHDHKSAVDTLTAQWRHTSGLLQEAQGKIREQQSTIGEQAHQLGTLGRQFEQMQAERDAAVQQARQVISEREVALAQAAQGRQLLVQAQQQALLDGRALAQAQQQIQAVQTQAAQDRQTLRDAQLEHQRALGAQAAQHAQALAQIQQQLVQAQQQTQVAEAQAAQDRQALAVAQQQVQAQATELTAYKDAAARRR